jgi:hypothetical protein
VCVEPWAGGGGGGAPQRPLHFCWIAGQKMAGPCPRGSAVITSDRPLPCADGSPALGSLADAGLAAAFLCERLAAEPNPYTTPRAAPAACACPSRCAGASVSEPGVGAGARTALGDGAGAWSAGFMAAPRSAQEDCVTVLLHRFGDTPNW